MVQCVALFLCKNYAVSGQKAEQPASTACLLAVLLINMPIYLAGVMADSMCNAICAATQTSKVPTRVAFCIYSVLSLSLNFNERSPIRFLSYI